MKLRSIKELVNTKFKIFNKNRMSKNKILEYIQKNPSEQVFLKTNDSFFAIDQENNEINYIPISTIYEKENIYEAIQRLENSPFTLVKDDSQHIIGFINIKSLATKLLKQFNHLYAFMNTTLNTIDVSCTIVDDQQRVMFWNKKAEEIFSVDAEKIIGKPITNFFKHDHLEILNTIKNGTSVKNKQHQARDDLIVMINSNPVYDQENIIGAVVSETDITSQVRLNKTLYETSKKVFKLEKEINSQDDPFKDIQGNSPKLNKTKDLMERASSTNANILILGESGVGKELFAKAMHNLRETKDAPFIAINCGAIPESLFESEIFGYESGAFSGASKKGKQGKVELASNGTLFLDEIGEMPLDMQVKLLRLLQEKRFFRIGGTKEIEVSFRVIAATNQNLAKLVKKGKFREDLYYRLNVVSIEIPPLRERPEDIIELTHYFLNEYSIKYNRPIHGISQQVMQALLQHNWPGNVRELKNVIERLIVLSEGGEIQLEDLPFEDAQVENIQDQELNLLMDHQGKNIPLKKQLEKYEREIILKELKKVDGNKAACAKNLEITRATLYNRMNRLGIDF